MTSVVELDYGRRPSALAYMVRGMLPVTRRIDLAPQIIARWHRHRVDRDDLSAFLRITGLPSADESLPLLYPHTFGFRLSMAILTHPTFPVPIWGVLQTRNHVVQRRPIAIDETLDFCTQVVQGRAIAKGAEFDLRTTVHVDDELAWESIVTFFARGRFGEPETPPTLARSPTAPDTSIAEWTMRDAGNWTFGRFTGDYNGIHMWDWYARRFGFPHALYHPPRVLGECLAHLPLAERNGETARLDAWIKGPVPHRAPVRLQATTTADESTFALFAADDRPSIVGRLSTVQVQAHR